MKRVRITDYEEVQDELMDQPKQKLLEIEMRVIHAWYLSFTEESRFDRAMYAAAVTGLRPDTCYRILRKMDTNV